MNVRGKLIPLSEGRLVYVGTDRDRGDNSLFIAFRNAKGEDTKLRLSPEAVLVAETIKVE